MASITKRKEQVNQLRKAHFALGFESNQGLRSQYAQGYVQHSINATQNYGDRNSHFTIASDEPNMAKNTYQSQFKDKYPPQSVPQNKSIKKRNDENNIVLGFGTQGNLTNYRDQYAQKASQPVQPVNQRVVNVDLGDTLSDFTTSYHKAYDGTQGNRREKINSNSGNNVVLGYDPNMYATSSAASHNSKPMLTNKGPVRNYETNILLGADNNQFASENRTQYSHKNSSKQSVDKNRVLDFKSAHFKFGFPDQTDPNISEAQYHYSQKPLTLTVVQGKKPTNVELKHDNKNYFQSSYGEHYQPKKGEKTQILNANGRNNNVVIGLGTEIYNTQAKDQFVAKPIERVKGQGTEGSLSLGNGDRQFKTQYQDNFANKFDQRQSNRVGKEQIQKMRVQNFVKGFSDVDYQLHSQSYGRQTGQGNKLPRQVIDKMRGTNIVNSDTNAFYGTTSHKESYSWKRNDDF